MKKDLKVNYNYQSLVTQISEIYKQGQENAAVSVNAHLVKTYWQIGQYIVEFEQEGKQRAEYGKALINNLSKDLSLKLGKGFSRSNLIYMRLFYLELPISEKVSHLLSWSHYIELLKISDKLERNFYFQQTLIGKWSIPELKRQKKSSLYLKCFVLIDLKKEEAGYEDVGQRNMYLGYFENEENTESDSPPIGIVLAKEKDDLLVQYALHNISSQLFVNKYQLYLPNKEELRHLIETQLRKNGND